MWTDKRNGKFICDSCRQRFNARLGELGKEEREDVEDWDTPTKTYCVWCDI